MRDITVGGRIYWDFHTQPSAEFRQNGAKTKPSRGQQFSNLSQLMRKVREDSPRLTQKGYGNDKQKNISVWTTFAFSYLCEYISV